MTYLVDTNILLRIANQSDRQHQIAMTAIAKLHKRGERLATTAQNLIEFYNGATRPIVNNGLGLAPTIANQEIVKFRQVFEWLDETPAIYPMWEHLIAATAGIGKQVHDTRLAAVCHVHQVSHILTCNVKDFARFQNVAPGIVVIDPASIS